LIGFWLFKSKSSCKKPNQTQPYSSGWWRGDRPSHTFNVFFVLHPPMNSSHGWSSFHTYFNSFHTHLMFSWSLSDDIENKINNALSCFMDEAMSMLVAEMGGPSHLQRYLIEHVFYYYVIYLLKILCNFYLHVLCKLQIDRLES
jgi:hypothetical protein